MGRPGKATTALARIEEAPLQGALESTEAQRLTARFLELRKQVHRSLVDAAVELGEILREGKRVLRGSYLRWLADRLGIDHSTASNYIALSEMARQSPGLIERYRELGAAKLYKIARLPAAGRKEVLRTPNLQYMTDAEFHEVAGRHVERKRKVTGAMRAHGLGQKVKAMTESLKGVTPPRISEPERRAALRRALVDLARVARDLADTFK